VFWNPANTMTGNYTLKGTFKLLKPSGHTNYYGLVFGGSELEGANQNYLYFLVAQDGSWLVKRRNGEATENVVAKTPSDAVKKPDASGVSTNALEVRVLAGQARVRGERTCRRQRTEDGTSREDRRHLRDPLQSPARHRSRRIVGGQAVACVRRTRPANGVRPTAEMPRTVTGDVRIDCAALVVRSPRGPHAPRPSAFLV
jgi:hypothetical protein